MKERRAQILEAVLNLLAKEGLAKVTHRAVDTQASLPQGSTSYYFPKKSILVAAAAEHLGELMQEDCREVKQQFAELIAEGKRDAALEYVADDLLNFADERQDWLLARFELTLAGSRDGSLREATQRLTQAAREPVAFFLKLLAADVSEARIDACMGVLDGLSLMYATGQGPRPTKEQLERLFATA